MSNTNEEQVTRYVWLRGVTVRFPHLNEPDDFGKYSAKLTGLTERHWKAIYAVARKNGYPTPGDRYGKTDINLSSAFKVKCFGITPESVADGDVQDVCVKLSKFTGQDGKPMLYLNFHGIGAHRPKK